ncbi:hypothetical protein HN358_02125 [Candidatus Uhrbacteria bacterium]|nr:hypothetical protein [Candidatus Uhrbacteria bacterium]MBT7716901.1 hypothetical protein [Candidatus Uhrbacteria bacterium]
MEYPANILSNRDEDPKILNNIENALKERRGFTFSLEHGCPVVFLISGGLDSMLIMDRLLGEYGCEIYPLYIERGARAGKFEKQCCEKYCEIYQERYPKLFHSMEVVQMNIPPKEFKLNIGEHRLNTIGHPMRNAVIQSIGVQYAVSLSSSVDSQIKHVFTATSPDDTFPHSSLLSLRSLTLMACVDGGDWGWQISSPLLEPTLWGELTKEDMIRYAVEHDLPLEHTRTCTRGDELACAKCPECLCRLRAFAGVGIQDPIAYKI